MKDEHGTLLVTLLKLMNFSYLSDLRFQSVSKSVVEHVEESQYSIEEWNEAINYITDQESECSTPQEAKAFLLSLLKE